MTTERTNKQSNMITKQFTPKKTVCKVTFKVPAEWATSEVSVVGDFNDWDKAANVLEMKSGAWETTVRLTPGNEYKFRYFIDGERWENDDNADGYVANEFGTDDSLLIVEA
jgi:1,4-alpha-glucan branching enzyme